MYPILESLQWRYATELFDPNRSVSDDLIETLLESALLAPSSMNFQPWKWILVKNTELREQLYQAGYRQQKIKASPHLLALTARTTIEQQDIEDLMDITKSTRRLTEEDLAGYRRMLEGFLQGKSTEYLAHWARRQAYISLGFLLETAALLHIDTAPMEGFDTTKADQILQLTDTGYSSTTLIALGHRSDQDIRINWAKVRFPKERMIEERS